MNINQFTAPDREFKKKKPKNVQLSAFIKVFYLLFLNRKTCSLQFSNCTNSKRELATELYISDGSDLSDPDQ